MQTHTHTETLNVTAEQILSVINHLPQRIAIKDGRSVYLSCNSHYARDLGLNPDAIIGQDDFAFFPAELAERYRADDQRVMAEGITIEIEEPYVRGEEKLWIRTLKTPLRDHSGLVCGVVLIFNDITASKLAQEQQERDSWALAALSDCNRALVFASSEQDLLQQVCGAITASDRYPLAWIGWAEDDPAKTVSIRARAGSKRAYLEGLHVSWSDCDIGNGPTGKSIRLGEPQVMNDASHQQDFIPWREQAGRHGIQASVALPIRMGNRIVAALMVYGREVNTFQQSEVSLFEEMANNISYGLTTRRTRVAWENSEHAIRQRDQALKTALTQALEAIAATLEQRDPYTAGHQHHVADLAVKIGQEMRLPEERLKALYFASIVHDIGKIQVPAEVLSKPGRLTPVEFALIKHHPEVAYQILKNIAFPWPIADIVRQHHEYLDGSGYPQGLKGADILLESRILTVADIVESMSADRPYRPALGVEMAMQEIIRLRGERLDIGVVDACCRVIQRGDFMPAILLADRLNASGAPASAAH